MNTVEYEINKARQEFYMTGTLSFSTCATLEHIGVDTEQLENTFKEEDKIDG